MMLEEDRVVDWRKIAPSAVWVAAVAVAVAAIVVDHEWTPASKRDGPPVLLVIALLVLLALLVPQVRAELRRVRGLSVGGLEVNLAALTEVVADPITEAADRANALPINPEEGDPDEKSWRPRIVASVDARRAEAAVEALATQLGERLDWIWRNLPDLGKRPVSDAEAVARLERHGLLPSAQAQILRVVATIEFDAIARTRSTNRYVLERFLRQADAVVHTSRLLAFDSYVRTVLVDEGFILVDWRPQPEPQRWRDFLAHGIGPMAPDAPDVTFWIAVRVAQRADSILFRRTVDRLAAPHWRTEVPGGPDAKPLVVVPDSSSTPLETKGDVQALRLRDLRARVRAG